jgi:Zn-dependent M28 family amino/carboxypeptidase
MLISRSDSTRPPLFPPNLSHALVSISRSELEESVKAVSIPRNFISQPHANRQVADWIAGKFQELGYAVSYQGRHHNVVAVDSGCSPENGIVIVGAHYDSVARTPGADDNASGVAALLSSAGALSTQRGRVPAYFVAFNREEDGLLGSRDFVRNFLLPSKQKVREAHILEMVGYCRHNEDTQRLPRWLPRRIGTRGDFLGILGNRHSGRILRSLAKDGKTYVSGLPVVTLKLPFGIERYLPRLRGSDHYPFWQAALPAAMWTDTAEFRNPNYHRPGDLADTLDYVFLEKVTRLLTAHILALR